MTIKPYIVYLSGGGRKTNRERLLTLCCFWSKISSRVRILTTEATANVLYNEIKGLRSNIMIDRILFSNREPAAYWEIFLETIKRAILGSIKKVPKDINLIYSMTGIITEVMPGFFFKMRNSKLRWVVLMDNLVLPPSQRPGNYFVNLLAYLGFRLSVLLSKKADIILQCNSSVKKELLKLGITEEKIKPTSNGIMLNDIRQIAEPIVKKYEAVFLGRLHYTKGIFDLVKIWANIIKIKPRAKLALIGDGEKAIVIKLKREIKKNNLENNILFLGYLIRKEKFKALKEGRIFVFPSSDESWGVAVMEALACGLPAVVYDLAIYREIYSPHLLQRAQIGNLEKFTNQVLTLLNNRRMREKLSDGGKEEVEHFSWDAIVQKEIVLLRRLLKD